MNTKPPSLNPPTPGTPGLRLPAARDFAARLAAILSPLLALLNRYAPALGPAHMPLHARIVRAGQRLARLLTRLAEGTFRPHKPRPTTKGGPPAIHLPHQRAWIVAKLGYHAAAYASQLQFLLNDPATQSLLAAAPPGALKPLGRTLRPLCRLLGVDLPNNLQRPPHAKPGHEPNPAEPPANTLTQAAETPPEPPHPAHPPSDTAQWVQPTLAPLPPWPFRWPTPI